MKMIRAIFLKSILATAILITLCHFQIAGQGKNDSKDWSIVASYTIPGKASGLAWDGNVLYYGIYGAGGDQVYTFDPVSGTASLLFYNPDVNDSYGMTYDGSSIWITDHGLSSSVPAYAARFDDEGYIVEQFDLPDHYMSGIAWDDGNFWVCTYFPDPGTIYQVDGTGTILQQIPSPDEQPWDICLEGENLWVADYYGDALYKIDQQGNVIESHPSENIKPSGIVFDGNYLWYVDGELSSPSTLYKVDLGGVGTPVINVPVTTFNYGNVILEDSVIWECTIANDGSADLEIFNIVIQNAVPIFMNQAFPVLIPEENSTTVEIWYKPTEPGALNTIAVVESSDPVNPETELLLIGEAIFEGPHIQLPVTQYNFGSVRQNATTRWFLDILNNGSETLEINEIVFSNPNFYIDESLFFPIEIGVLETFPLGIWFQPDGAGTFVGNATIANNDPGQGTIQLILSGVGDDASFPIGAQFWTDQITTGFDNSIKGIAPLDDVSGDGITDVIVCSEDDYIRCYNGNASGNGDVLWAVEAGSVYGQNGITTLEDINGDGVDEAVVGLAWGVRAVKVLSGQTGEQLWMFDTHIYGDGGWVYQVWTGLDYNQDDQPDVLAASGNDANNTGPKRIFCLDGMTGAVLWNAFTDGPNFSCIGLPDFTGDGIPDAIGGASTNDETTGKVYGINGSDGSIEWTHTTTGSSVWALEQLDDITGDGINDCIAGDFSGNYTFLDAANGNVLFSGYAGNTLFLRFERLEDVNGNGFADIAFAYSGSNAIVVDGESGENIWFTALTDKCWNIDKIPDISGDGINDLIAGTLFSNNSCYFLNGATGEILHFFPFGEAVDAIAAIPDINNDGSWEMVAGGREGKLVCYSSGEVVPTGFTEYIQKDQALVASPNPFHFGTSIRVNRSLARTDKILIYDLQGNLIRTLEHPSLHGDSKLYQWNGKDNKGKETLPGMYLIRSADPSINSTLKILRL
jgi:hypothetical protein